MSAPPGRAPKRTGGVRKPREERWAELLDVASRVFYEKGYQASSLQDIADALGLLKGSLYYYIQSKDDLLFEVIKDTHEAGMSNILALSSGDGTALERLERTIVGHVEQECRNVAKTAVYLHEVESLSDERRREILGEGQAYQAVFRELIRDGQAEGSVRADIDPRLATMSILGSMNWIYRWYRPGGSFSARAIGENIADFSVRGIATAEVVEQRDKP